MLRLIKNKGCQRCGGSLSLERDAYGAYVACIQCGAVWNQPEVSTRPRPVEREPTTNARVAGRR